MSNDRTSQLIGRLREAAEWLAEDIPEGTPEIEHLEGDVRLDELDLYCVWLMRQAADALSDPNPILAARVEEIEAARQSAEARVEELRDLAYDLLGTLVAALSVLNRAEDRGHRPSQVVASRRMFQQMLKDYEASVERARAALQPKPADQVSVEGE